MSLRKLLIPVFATLSVAAGPASTIRSESECARAHAWVARHKADLPTHLDGLSRYSMVYRRAIYAATPLEGRKLFWREHFATYTTGPSAYVLTAKQKALVEEAASRLDVLLGENASNEREAIVRRALAEFGRPLATRVFATLGSVPESATVSICDCHQGSVLTCVDIVGPNTECRESQCREAAIGCGTFWASSCNGTCQPERS